jgi:hypothetical protein
MLQIRVLVLPSHYLTTSVIISPLAIRHDLPLEFKSSVIPKISTANIPKWTYTNEGIKLVLSKLCRSSQPERSGTRFPHTNGQICRSPSPPRSTRQVCYGPRKGGKAAQRVKACSDPITELRHVMFCSTTHAVTTNMEFVNTSGAAGSSL